MPTMYPYLSYRDAASALRFLEEAFGFTTNVRWDAPDGSLQHAEATFGDGALMGTAEHPTAPLEGASVGQGIYVYVADVDAHFERARAAGARVVYPPEDTEWGTRRYRVLTLKATNGVLATTGPAANPRRPGPR
jgi:uncharacterized glyoxalase superfamily protein PhnB